MRDRHIGICLYRGKRYGANFCTLNKRHCGMVRALVCCARDALGGILERAGDGLRKIRS